MSKGSQPQNKFGKSVDIDLELIAEDIQETGGLEPSLRNEIDDRDQFILDDSVILDYALKRGRKSTNGKTCYTATETYLDVENLIEEFSGSIHVPSGFRKIVESHFREDNFDLNLGEVEERLDRLELVSQEIDLTEVNPRDDYREVRNPDLRDDKLAEYSQFADIPLLAYDSDFLDYSEKENIDITTPGMI